MNYSGARVFADWPRLARVMVLGLGALAALWCLASLFFPFGWDQGIMASVGDAIVRGGLPYRDAWDMKGPLTFYVFALVELLLGRNMWGIRVFDILLLILGALALARVVARLTNPTIGWLAAITLILWYGSLGWFFVSQPDGWIALLMVLALTPLFLAPGELPALRLVLSGGLIGCCLLVKPFFGAFLLAPFVFILFSNARPMRKVGVTALLGLAFAFVPLLLVGWLAYRGGLQSFIEVHFRYSSAYAESLRPDRVARRIFNYLWVNGVPTPAGAIALIMPGVVYGAYALIRAHRQVGLTILTWLVVALFCVAIQGKFWVYHWIPTFPPFVLLGAYGLWSLATAAGARVAGWAFALVAAALFLGKVAVLPAVDVARWFAYVAHVKSRDAYYRQFVRRFYVAADEMIAARYLREKTGATDEIVLWGNDATVTYLSGRPSATRFVFAMPLTRNVADSMRAEYRREYMRNLIDRRPLYFVIGQPHDGSIDKAGVLRSFPELYEFVHTRYQMEKTIGFLELYRRNPW